MKIVSASNRKIKLLFLDKNVTVEQSKRFFKRCWDAGIYDVVNDRDAMQSVIG